MTDAIYKDFAPLELINNRKLINTTKITPLRGCDSEIQIVTLKKSATITIIKHFKELLYNINAHYWIILYKFIPVDAVFTSPEFRPGFSEKISIQPGL